MKVKIVSYYTTGNGYDKEVERLRASLQKFKLDAYLQAFKPFPSWRLAVAYKPTFIRSMQELYAPYYSGLLFTDADSEFVAQPDWSLFENGSIAACRFQRTPSHPVETLTGTVFVSTSEKGKIHVDHWIAQTKLFMDTPTPEQDGLSRIGPISHLPIEYCFIFDDFKEIFPKKKPVIVHYQASRRLNRDYIKRPQR